MAGCSTSRVYRLLRRHGVTGNSGAYNTAAMAERERIIAEYQAGATLAAIARQLSVDAATVRNVLARSGVPRRRRGPQARPFSDAECERVRLLRQAGASIEEIADELHRSTSAVSAVVAELGLPSRIARRDRAQRIKVGSYYAVWLAKEDPFYPMAHGLRSKAGQFGGYVLEHRLVMARHLGRCLERGETVHHIDGDHGRNDLSNLQLRVGNHGKGVRMVCCDCGSANVRAVPLP